MRIVSNNTERMDRPMSRSLTKFDHEREKPPLCALTPIQGEYIKALNSSEQVISIGSAGTGKTYIAATHTADKFRKRKIDKIYITRPNIPGGRSLGFFPGSLEEKIAPWAVPVTEVLKERMGNGAFDVAMSNGDIEIVPFEVMRGRTFKNCVVLLDEAQNTTPQEMKMFLTRIGENCQVIINGDISQTDLNEKSGLATIIHLIKSRMMNVPIVEFTVNDIVRSGICEEWVRAFADIKV